MKNYKNVSSFRIQDSRHVPVLLKEVVEILDSKPGDFIIDGTVGGGGHAAKIFERILPNGKLLGIDLDKENLIKAEAKILAETKNQKPKTKNNLILIQGNYADLPEILKEKKLPKADGLILDLGFSSEQLESGKGFSFLRDEILDMRYNVGDEIADEIKNQKSKIKSITAAEIINTFREEEIADIIFKYGEERYSRRIAKAIVEERKKKRILTTFDLVEIIKKAVPGVYQKGRRHPAMRTFQALRIYVNQELDNLETILKNINQILKIKGRVLIISFHSLEDRLVKNYFRQMVKEGLAEFFPPKADLRQRRMRLGSKPRAETKKPVRPTEEEIEKNPRSRSAKLRAIQLVDSEK